MLHFYTGSQLDKPNIHKFDDVLRAHVCKYINIVRTYMDLFKKTGVVV